ncbi:MAG: hypothetical protein DMF85_01230 [Acidobacteria bacterium]|nr:MAG: hypothetical protein DMF85_01230 [Acidobacteriota bacterium]
MTRTRSLLTGILLLATVAATQAVQQQRSPAPAGQGQEQPQDQGQAQGRRGQGPARDRAQQPAPQGTAIIAGRVLSVDNGRPIKRARVSVTAPAARVARATVTDEQGRFQIGELVAGTYTISASKAGFVDGIYGQRRPAQPGTPVQLSDGQQLGSVDVRLLRGGVITGRVLDEDGEPLARAMVTVMRYQYVRGERQLTPAGVDQSDDRGQYRVFGLPPGEYFVSATATGIAGALRGVAAAVIGGAGAGRGGPGRGGPGALGGGLGALFGAGAEADPEPTGYAPTYYPGVIAPSEATKIPVAGGQETTGIDFQLQLVPTITVSGIVVGTEGTSVGVTLLPDDGGAGILRGQMFRANTKEDGTFSIVNVTPGRYTAVARSGGRSDEPRAATQNLLVNGENITGLTLTLIGGITVSGNITVESSGTPAPADYSTFRVNLTSADSSAAAGPLGRFGGPGGGAGTRAEKNGAFTAENVLPGKYVVTAQGPSPRTLKAVNVGGRDATDQVVELRGGPDVNSVTVVFSDRSTQIDGTVRTAAGTPAQAMTVIAFSSDPLYWRAQSRHIQVARTNQSGAYHLQGLPPGDYLMIAVDDVEQGEWFDPSYLAQIKDAATAISLSDGDKKTRDLTPRS